ncbi:hypothetical protein HN587_02180 [Candidatus Woesearchaeota archaeon]|jgi:hypothetical protein|nr:hypothetical protein [Candidatus Woesearchaeota archaeon]
MEEKITIIPKNIQKYSNGRFEKVTRQDLEDLGMTILEEKAGLYHANLPPGWQQVIEKDLAGNPKIRPEVIDEFGLTRLAIGYNHTYPSNSQARLTPPHVNYLIGPINEHLDPGISQKVTNEEIYQRSREVDEKLKKQNCPTLDLEDACNSLLREYEQDPTKFRKTETGFKKYTNLGVTRTQDGATYFFSANLRSKGSGDVEFEQDEDGKWHARDVEIINAGVIIKGNLDTDNLTPQLKKMAEIKKIYETVFGNYLTQQFN